MYGRLTVICQWAHVKHSLANLANLALNRPAALGRNRLKRLPYRPDVLGGFLARTGLAIDSRHHHPEALGQLIACVPPRRGV